MVQYKVDWLAFSIKFASEDIDPFSLDLFEELGYDLGEFEETPGRYFYNSGLTFFRFVNVYWNDPNKKRHVNSSDTLTVVFTGQGCTDLAEKICSDWVSLFQKLLDVEGLKFTRIDLSLDDFEEKVSFSALKKKLELGHYRSSKRSYNIVTTSDTLGRPLGETIYIGNARADNGSRGNVYARFYDKKAQYLSKNQLLPTGVETWKRYEISFSKKYAIAVIDRFVAGENIDKVFKTSLRNLLEILTPKENEKNKARWYKTRWWEKFLEYDEKIDFGIAERDVMLGGLLNWIKVSVLPSLSLLEQIGLERGFNIYELLELAKKPVDFTKKQNRLYNNARQMTDKEIMAYLSEFLGGDSHG